MAGGLELLLCCDLVIASESATLGDAHANYGLIPGGGASARLPRRIGVAARHLLFTGAIVPARRLEHSGLLNAVVADAEFEPAARELVATLAGKSPLGLARMKQLVATSLDVPLADALLAEQALAGPHGASDDVREGLAAFAEKRVPRFTGR